MSRELDVRNFSTNRVTPDRTVALQALAAKTSEKLPGTQKITIEGFDAGTGNSSHIAAQAAPAEQGRFIERALQYVQAVGPAMGLAMSQATSSLLIRMCSRRVRVQRPSI
jgi:hypothetical protein